MSISFENNDDFDEHLLDMIFLSGQNVSKGIQWMKYSEIEIQGIIKTHFEYQGYEVIWRHRDDAANEKGVDLECQNKKKGKTISIAVKKKPNKNALGQLVELSKVSADVRLYVYVGGSTQSFRDNINYFTNIEFWTEIQLEKILNDTGLTLRLKVDNSLANQAMSSITYNIVIKSKREKNNHSQSIEYSRVMNTLWGLKDRAVTVHKCAEMLQLLFEKSELFGKIDDDQIQNLAIWGLDYLYINGLLTLRLEFESLSPQLTNILQIAHEKTRTRSNWFELYTYQAGFLPGKVLSTLERYEKSKNKMKKIEDKYDKIIGSDISEIEPMSQYKALVNLFRYINVWSDGLEGTIDYMFEYSADISP